MKFIVRLGYNIEFAQQKWNEGISVSTQIMQMLEDYVIEKISDGHISYVVFVIEAENAKAGEEHIRNAWAALYPDNQNALTVMMVLDDDSDTAKVMRVIYNV